MLPLRLQDVSFLRILQPLSLEIEAGPSTVILGANGAGKSVLMRLMHGLLKPSSGTVSGGGAQVVSAKVTRPIIEPPPWNGGMASRCSALAHSTPMPFGP